MTVIFLKKTQSSVRRRSLICHRCKGAINQTCTFFYDGKCFPAVVLRVLAILSCNLGLHAMSKIIYMGKLASVLGGVSSFFIQIQIKFIVYVHLKFVGMYQIDSFLRTSVFFFISSLPVLHAVLSTNLLNSNLPLTKRKKIIINQHTADYDVFKNRRPVWYVDSARSVVIPVYFLML